MRWFALPLVLFVIAGCARVAVTTKIEPDGSFTRKIRYAVKKGGDGLSQSGPQTVEDAFRLPTGSTVTVTKKTEKDELIAEATQSIAAGTGALKDLVILSEKKAPLVESSVTVRKLADGKLEYVEHLHWIGAIPPGTDMEMPAEIRAIIKKSLPERFVKTEIIDGVRHDLMLAMVHALFGPSQPMFFDLLTNTDSAERRLIGQVAPQLIASMKTRMPDLTDDEALAVARSIAGALKLSDFAKDKANAAQPGGNPDSKKSDSGEMTPMTFVVGFPGKIVESNGITDPLSGEVYWSLYPPSLQLGDVDLRVVASP